MTRVISNSKHFDALETASKAFEASGRTDSAALLLWFLQTIYRLEDVEAEDAVCDQKHDQGIDALVVNNEQRQIVLVQAKRKQKLPSTLGDTDLKQFVGALQQFVSEASVLKLISTTQNPELVKLLTSLDVAKKIDQGYTLRPIFLTNVAAGTDATNYLSIAKDAGFDINLWDLTRLGPVLDQLAQEWFVSDPVRLRLAENKYFLIGPKTAPKLVFAAISAKELVAMPGISDTRIFAQNVRLGLGDTRVNDEIVRSVETKSDHPGFLTYHNGLTIVAKHIQIIRGQMLSLKEYSVCNGCQSLLTFFQNRNHLTDRLEVLVRVVQVGEDRRLAERIAYRTNNQNAISLRDLSANDAGQVRLKASFDDAYASFSTYVIKRGEESTTPPLNNEFAGQLVLALYVGQPFAAHQKYRVFGDLENLIFNYDITAPRIRLAQLSGEVVATQSEHLKRERVRKYGLTKFLLLYLLGEVLREEDAGKTLLSDPGKYLSTSADDNPLQANVLSQFSDLTYLIVTQLNYFIDENGGEAYDYKSHFKSQENVKTIRNDALKEYDRAKHRGTVKPFELPA